MWLSYIDVFLHFYFVIWKSYSSAYLLRHRKLADDLRIPTCDVTKRAFRRSLGLKCEDVLLHTDKTLQKWGRVNQEIIVLIWNYRWKSQSCVSSLTFCIQQDSVFHPIIPALSPVYLSKMIVFSWSNPGGKFYVLIWGYQRNMDFWFVHFSWF